MGKEQLGGKFPSVLFDFNLDWVFDPLNGFAGGLPAVQFSNLQLDLGQFFGEFVGPVLDAIRRSAMTGRIGDGKIFVTDVGEAVRIRTGERGEGVC